MHNIRWDGKHSSRAPQDFVADRLGVVLAPHSHASTAQYSAGIVSAGNGSSGGGVREPKNANPWGYVVLSASSKISSKQRF